MIGRKRMDNLHYCIEKVLSEKIPGDFKKQVFGVVELQYLCAVC